MNTTPFKTGDKLVYLPGHCPTGPAEDLGADGQHDLPVAGVDVGGLVAGQHRAAVDVGLAVQQGEPAPVLHVENSSHLQLLTIYYLFPANMNT